MNMGKALIGTTIIIGSISITSSSLALSPVEPQLLKADAGLRLWSRSFRYSDTAAQLFPREKYGQPSDYTVPVAPALRLGLEAFPGLLLGDSWLSYIGLYTQLNLGFATSTPITTEQGTVSARNEYFNLLAGLKGRIPLGPLQLEPSFGWGTDSSALQGLEGQSSPIAAVSYSFLRPGLSATGRLAKLSLEARAAYRIGLKVGEIGEDFPGANFPPPTFTNASYLGFDLGATVGYELHENWDVQFGIDVTQYGLDFNPVDPDLQADLVAGGATDRYLSFWFGLSFHLGTPTEPVDAGTDETQELPDSDFDDDFDEF